MKKRPGGRSPSLSERSLRGATVVQLALQQAQGDLRLRVGLCEHGNRRLLKDRVPRQVSGLEGHVDVADATLGGGQVLLGVAEASNR